MREYGEDIVVNWQHVWWGRSSQRNVPYDHPRLDTGVQRFSQVRQRYWVDTEDDHFLFSGGRRERIECRNKALCWAAIMYKIGLDKMDVDSGSVPIEIVNLGKPYVAAYLYAVHEYEFSEISDQLEIVESTISQYLSDVAGLRR